MKAPKKLPRAGQVFAGATLVLIAVAILLGASLFAQGLAPSALSFVRSASSTEVIAAPLRPSLDTLAYDEKLLYLAHVATSSPWYTAFLTGKQPAATSTSSTGSGQASTTVTQLPPKPLWPVKRAYPLPGALLPFNRIVAYYGNFYSKQMGVLGEYPENEVLQKLASTSALWQAADPQTPVIPAIHYIVVTAQGTAGKDGLYRARMPDDQIDKALEMAAKVDGLVFLDFQVGKSTVQKELPQYAKYLALPNVEVGIDPEFSMKGAAPPGTVIGTFDAADVNWVANYLAGIVKANDLAPKILVVHRFTEDMVTNAQKITPLPEVQVVVDMDGWGYPAKKVHTYTAVIAPEPVQFTGFKLFYKADLQAPDKRIMSPQEVLSLTPAPIYIQYQ